MTKHDHQSNALQVRQALWNLQKEILNSLKDEYDRENGFASNPTEWFGVLMNAERYAWLRELTSLMADIDIMTELDFLTEQHVAVARAEIERLLLEQSHEPAGFNKHYRDLLMSGISLLPLHAHLKSVVQTLPSKQIPKDQSIAERKAWHEEHRHQSRKKRN